MRGAPWWGGGNSQALHILRSATPSQTAEVTAAFSQHVNKKSCSSRRKMRCRYLEVLTHSFRCQCGQNSVGTVISGLLWCRITAQGKVLLHTCNDSLCWFLLYFVDQETTSLKTGLITVCFFCNYCQLTYHHLI